MKAIESQLKKGTFIELSHLEGFNLNQVDVKIEKRTTDAPSFQYRADKKDFMQVIVKMKEGFRAPEDSMMEITNRDWQRVVIPVKDIVSIIKS